MPRARTVGAVLGWCAAAVLAAPAPAAAPVAHGSLEHVWIPARSIHGEIRSVRIYLPPSYHDPRAATRRYPLVLLLHGWPGGDGNWPGQGRAAITLDSMIARRRIPELIALMPNANGPGLHGRSRYLDPIDHSFDIQEFLTRDLVHWADSALRTRPEPSQRAVIGLSDGGGGAINLALRHPEVFGGAAGLSGQYQLGRVWGEGRVLGSEPGASRRRAQSSPYLYIGDRAASARTQALFIGCGLADKMIADNRAFHARLDSLAIPHSYVETPGGHSWKVWRRLLPDALQTLTARMRVSG